MNSHSGIPVFFGREMLRSNTTPKTTPLCAFSRFFREKGPLHGFWSNFEQVSAWFPIYVQESCFITQDILIYVLSIYVSGAWICYLFANMMQD